MALVCNFRLLRFYHLELREMREPCHADAKVCARLLGPNQVKASEDEWLLATTY